MSISANLGFPRIGRNRELKRALEGYWSGKIDRSELESVARQIRRDNWQLQRDAGIDHIPSNDFSYYDQVLDACAMVGAVPHRYGWEGGTVDLDLYFGMARGIQEAEGGRDVTAMEMTKWFDTNYHFIVPEFWAGQEFSLASHKVIDEFTEALELGIKTRPVLLGPVSFVLLGKVREGDLEPLDLLDGVLGVYEDVLRRLAEAGAEWVQIDEPCLGLDLDDRARAAYGRAYDRLRKSAEKVGGLKLLVATYFSYLGENLDTAVKLPVDGLHVDLVRAPQQLEPLLGKLPQGVVLSAGVVDGRNIWANDLEATLGVLEQIATKLGPERLIVAPSCSMIHVPIDLAVETELDEEVRAWMAFAVQKLDELVVLARVVRDGRESEPQPLADSRHRIDAHRGSTKVHRAEVKSRLAGLGPDDARRDSPFAERRLLQRQKLGLGPFPTTTIGSFPQTKEVRATRAAFNAGRIDRDEYERFLETEIEKVIRFQEEIGIDVVVHGEPERNDMVQYFGEQLSGYAFTKHAWVQSYGSRYVRPPIVYGDVTRPKPMTVRWAKYAVSITDRPVKGMLTGPVTMLQWSFVRDDQPRSVTARQIALAIRDEVADLEAAGVSVIQIDEPAMREGLPLRRKDWQRY
ncbi:MAG: 5-methyltetrahydropteroyltriglutamate--homocysteine S-methyltransferase, partial [Planctomycetota bacterium]